MNAGAFWLFVLAMLGFIYFLMIRPQRQQQRRHQDMLSTLKPGDEVITAGGLYGEVKRLDSDRVALEIDDDVEVVVAKRAIASVVPPEELGEENQEEGETTSAEEPSPRA